MRGDVRYFAHSLRARRHVGPAHTLVEYPVPALGALELPWRLVRAVGLATAYDPVIVVLALLTDAAFMLMLVRWTRPAEPWGGLTWILAVPLLGATAYARFDLLPGVLVGAMVLLADVTHGSPPCAWPSPPGSQAWPALLIPGLVSAARRRGAVLLAVVVTGAVLVVASVAYASWGRLFSPLTYQSQRGLQIESIVATPVMMARLIHPHWWRAFYSVHHAYEVVGPGTHLLLQVSTGLTVLLALLLLGTWVVLFVRRRPLPAAGLVWLTLAAVTGFVATKVFSPQYMLWVLPPAAAGLVVLGKSRRLVVWTATALVRRRP